MAGSRIKIGKWRKCHSKGREKETQYTLLHSVKASVYKGLQRRATFYFPIWWGIAAWPVDRFIADNDFTGKTVIPFCTSSSFRLGESGELLGEAAGTGEWLTGERFRSGASEETVRKWVESLSLE